MSPWPAALLAGAAVAALLTDSPAAARVRALLTAPARARAPGQLRWSAPAGAIRLRQAAPAGVATAVVMALGAGPVAAALAGGGALALRRWRARRDVAAAVARERSRAVEACAVLAGELRAGRSPAQALDAAAELAVGSSGRSLRSAAAAAGLGGDVAGALQPGPETAVPQLLRALAVCWSVCSGSGAGLAAAVERLEQGLRADADQRRDVQAELAGPRATAGMLAVLPLAGLLLAAGLGADPLHVLFGTPVGVLCLITGLALDGLGLFWTGRLVARAGG